MIWLALTFASIGLSIALIIWRAVAIVRLPVHLRWELAPIPGEKGRECYGGSHFEVYECWKRPQERSRLSPVLYMVKEIILFRRVWSDNRSLWPFVFALHMGIYLVGAVLCLNVLHAALSVFETPPRFPGFLLGLASVMAIAGYLLGTFGAIGLLLKRVLDAQLRPFNVVSTYGHLLFLAAVSVSGAAAWFTTDLSDTGLFIKGITLSNTHPAVTPILAVHIVLLSLLLLYLPFTNMIHFVAKYFMYHGIRWNDEPQDEHMKQALRVLLGQRVNWSASHVGADGTNSWVDITSEKTRE